MASGSGLQSSGIHYIYLKEIDPYYYSRVAYES